MVGTNNTFFLALQMIFEKLAISVSVKKFGTSVFILLINCVDINTLGSKRAIFFLHYTVGSYISSEF